MPVRRSIAYDAHEERVADCWIALMNSLNVSLYEASDGRVAGRIPSGLPLLLLTTVGRLSGRRRTVTLAYLHDGDGYLVVGSKGGLGNAPSWVHNARAHPVVEVTAGSRRQRCVAATLSPVEAAAAIEEFAPYYRAFSDYGIRAAEKGRTIPVLRLTPFGPA